MNEVVVSLISVSMHEIKLKTINLLLLLPHFCARLTFQYLSETELIENKIINLKSITVVFKMQRQFISFRLYSKTETCLITFYKYLKRKIYADTGDQNALVLRNKQFDQNITPNK